MFAPIAADRRRTSTENLPYLGALHSPRAAPPRPDSAPGPAAATNGPAASRSSRSRPGAAARWRRFKAKGLAIA